MIEKIQDFYSVLNNDINFTDVNQLIKLIDEKINISDVDIHFPSSIIFYQQFKIFTIRNSDTYRWLKGSYIIRTQC